MSIKLIAIIIFCAVWAIVRIGCAFGGDVFPDWNIPDSIALPLFIVMHMLLPAFVGLILFLAFC